MKSNRDCKIVEDLLPNYIEGLTSEVTNYFIEEHIQSCERCKETLKAMQEQINAEKVDGKEEIDYLKKINRKTKKTERIATISIIVSVLLFVTILLITLPYQLWSKDSEGRINFIQQLFKPEEQTAQWTYYVAEKTIYDKENSLNGDCYKHISVVQLNDNNLQIRNYKIIYKGLTKEFLEQQKELLKVMQDSELRNIDNVHYTDNSISFNQKEFFNMNIEQIKELLIKYDDDGIIEEY